ncbi:hypothetical protein BAE44_0004747 [Dichanthelium oligosanthes]|uniref:AN1-type domain-containing protein n=1 Tax=Dichanthelium oligosanthes TaxID=888268 RepID=A0A1E5WA81_9POAL|nr:hypothetical protein BAE44_0004747 [Dichanthelium oligosanthes]
MPPPPLPSPRPSLLLSAIGWSRFRHRARACRSAAGLPQNRPRHPCCRGGEGRDRVRAEQPIIAQISAAVSSPPAVEEPAVKSTPNRCASCRKKVGLLGFACRCGGTFCSVHRYTEVRLRLRLQDGRP